MSVDITANRHRGAATSVNAFNEICASLPRKRAAVLMLFRNKPVTGFTVHEVAERFEVSSHVVSGRLSELKKSGHLEPNGERRDKSAVLVITRKGLGK